MQELLTPKQLADMLQVTAATVRRLTREGTIPSYRVGSPTGAIRIRRSDAEKALIAAAGVNQDN